MVEVVLLEVECDQLRLTEDEQTPIMLDDETSLDW